MIEALAKFVFVAIADFALAAIAMVALRVAHHTDLRVPAFGYWTTFFVLLALGQLVVAQSFAESVSDS